MSSAFAVGLLLQLASQFFSETLAMPAKENKAAVALALFRNRGPADRSNLCVIQTRTDFSAESRWFCPAALVSVEGQAHAIAPAECILHGNVPSPNKTVLTLNTYMYCNELGLHHRNFAFKVSSNLRPTIAPMPDYTDQGPDNVNRANMAMIRIPQEMMQEIGEKNLGWAFQPLETNFTNVANPKMYGTECRYVDLIEDHIYIKKRYVFPLLWEGVNTVKIAEPKFCTENWNTTKRIQMLCFVPAQEDPKTASLDRSFETLLCWLGRSPEKCATTPALPFEYSARRLYYCPYNCKANGQVDHSEQCAKGNCKTPQSCEWILSGIGRYYKKGMKGDLSVSVQQLWDEALWVVSRPERIAAVIERNGFNITLAPEDTPGIEGVIRNAIGLCGKIYADEKIEAGKYYCDYAKAIAITKVTPEFGAMGKATFRFNDCIKQQVRERNEQYDVRENLGNGNLILSSVIRALCNPVGDLVNLWQSYAEMGLQEPASSTDPTASGGTQQQHKGQAPKVPTQQQSKRQSITHDTQKRRRRSMVANSEQPISGPAKTTVKPPLQVPNFKRKDKQSEHKEASLKRKFADIKVRNLPHEDYGYSQVHAGPAHQMRDAFTPQGEAASPRPGGGQQQENKGELGPSDTPEGSKGQSGQAKAQSSKGQNPSQTQGEASQKVGQQKSQQPKEVQQSKGAQAKPSASQQSASSQQGQTGSSKQAGSMQSTTQTSQQGGKEEQHQPPTKAQVSNSQAEQQQTKAQQSTPQQSTSSQQANIGSSKQEGPTQGSTQTSQQGGKEEQNQPPTKTQVSNSQAEQQQTKAQQSQQSTPQQSSSTEKAKMGSSKQQGPTQGSTQTSQQGGTPSQQRATGGGAQQSKQTQAPRSSGQQPKQAQATAAQSSLELAKPKEPTPPGRVHKFLCPLHIPICYHKLILSPLLVATNAFNCSSSKSCIQELLDASERAKQQSGGEDEIVNEDEDDTQTTTDHSIIDAGTEQQHPEEEGGPPQQAIG